MGISRKASANLKVKLQVCYLAYHHSANARNVNYNGNVNHNSQNNQNGVAPVKEHVSSHEVVAAYRNCIRNKRNISGARYFSKNLLKNLASLKNDLNTNSYKVSPGYMFVVTWPKPREVWVGNFRDRVVDHLVASRIIPVITPELHPHNSACIKGRGTLFAINKVVECFRKCSGNYAKPVYFLKCDIKNYFTSIDKQVLIDLCNQLELDDFTKALIRTIVTHDCTASARFLTPHLHHKIPKHKSLINSKTGIPIGNYLSQIFSGYIYLHQLDRFITKHNYKHYVRYVDDFIILSESREDLVRLKCSIGSFLRTKLSVELSVEKSRIYRNEVMFCGRLVKPWRTYAIRRYFHSILHARNHESLVSYAGLIKHSNSYNAWRYCITNLMEFYNGRTRNQRDCTIYFRRYL